MSQVVIWVPKTKNVDTVQSNSIDAGIWLLTMGLLINSAPHKLCPTLLASAILGHPATSSRLATTY